MSALPVVSAIYDLIPKVMNDIGAVEKNRKNEQQKYSFRGIEDFYQAAHPAFVKHGIFCVPEVIEHVASTFERTNDYGKMTVWRHVTVKVRHRFYAGDGSYVDVTTMGEGLDNSDKATNKAMSGAMKYALIELFSVPTQDVEDSDRTSPEAGPERTTKPIKISSPAKPAAVTETVKGSEPQTAASTPQEVGLPAGVPASTREPGEDDEECIDLPRQRAIHRAFKDALKNEEARKNADMWLRTWLEKQGYKDAEGKGTTKTIPMLLFDEVKAAAIAFASSLPK